MSNGQGGEMKLWKVVRLEMCRKETETSRGSWTIYYQIWYQFSLSSFILNHALGTSVYTGIKSFTGGTRVLNITALLAGGLTQLPYTQSYKPATWSDNRSGKTLDLAILTLYYLLLLLFCYKQDQRIPILQVCNNPIILSPILDQFVESE